MFSGTFHEAVYYGTNLQSNYVHHIHPLPITVDIAGISIYSWYGHNKIFIKFVCRLRP